MDPERWRLANDLFRAVIARAPAARAAFLAAACPDEDLRELVERLLRADERARSFLDTAAARNARQLVESGSKASGSQPELPSYQAGLQFRGTDRFVVLRQLGSGGMGVVYEVRDRSRDEVVALKTLRRAGPDDIYRLKREFRSLADVAHPNLVSLYELVVDETNCFFTMELVQGVHFGDYVNRSIAPDGRSRAERARQCLRQLVEGIADLHRRGKLHRDIKPSNTLVTAAGRVVILDFGLSSDLADVAMTERMAGTPAYFAPERHAGAAPSPCQDWYSVGVTLYQALTGHVPFEGLIADTLRLQREHDPPPPREVSADVSEDLNAICVGLLQRDPAKRFADRHVLQALVNESVDATTAAAAVEPGRPTFVGRHVQLAALSDALSTADGRRAVAVHVHGPSGIGKSSLIECFLESALRGGRAIVLRGRCYEHESVPYKALDGVIDSLSQYLRSLPGSHARALMPADIGALARLFPVMSRTGAAMTSPNGEQTDPVVVRQRAFAALRELLTRLASQQPVIVYIDDLHWADADSALLLTELLHPPDAPAILTITCARSEEIASKPFLTALLSDAHQQIALRLEAMNAAEARALIASTARSTDTLSEEDVHAITCEADGNPFLLRQLTEHASTGPAWRARGRTFAEMLIDLTSALPVEAAAFLRMLAICGRPMQPELVFEAVGRGAGERASLRRLQAQHFVRSSGSAERVEVYHDRIRETIVAAMAGDEAQRLHGLMARAMVARQVDDPEALYVHHREAGDREAASAQAAAAARKADAALAFDRAAAYYRAALDLAPGDAASSSWQEALAAALANGGRPVASADVYLAAAQAADAVRRIELRRRAAEQFLLGGHIDRGIETIQSVLHAVGLRLPPGPRWTLAALKWRRVMLRWRGLAFVEQQADRVPPADLLRIDTCWSVASGLALVDSLRAAHFQTRCLLLALEAGEPYRIARSLAAEAGFSATAGRTSQRSTAALTARARTIAAATGNAHAIALAVLTSGVSSFMVGRWREARQLCEQALEMFQQQSAGAIWETALAQRMLIGSLMYEGRVREVTSRVTRLLTTARENGNVYWDTELRTGHAFVWLAQDLPEEAIRQADEAIAGWSLAGFHRQHYNHVLAHVQTELYRGRADRAWGLFAANWPAIKRSLLLRIQWTRIEASYWRARCALLAAAAGTGSRFRSIARGEARRIRRQRMPWADPLASLLSAAVAYLENDVIASGDLLANAVDGFDRAGMALHAAIARRRLSELANDDRGRELRAQADDWMQSEGIVNPVRMTRLIAPGFADPPETSWLDREPHDG